MKNAEKERVVGSQLMYTIVLPVLGMILAVMASPAEAQWNVSMHPIAVATGASRQIQIGVACQGNNQVVMLTQAESADFGNGKEVGSIGV